MDAMVDRVVVVQAIYLPECLHGTLSPLRIAAHSRIHLLKRTRQDMTREAGFAVVQDPGALTQPRNDPGSRRASSTGRACRVLA
jgi:hypothetical protein